MSIRINFDEDWQKHFKKPNCKTRCFVNLDNNPLVTEQAHKDMCNIDRIVEKYRKDDVIDHRNTNRGEYGFADGKTFEDAAKIVAKARSMFEELPANLRHKFNHSPSVFLDYVQNPANAHEMVKLGLATSVKDIPSETTQKVKATATISESSDKDERRKSNTKSESKNGDSTEKT